LYTYIQECNEFLAGNALRSASRYYKLDETAAFGSVCRHDFPSLFLNLKHGERLGCNCFSLMVHVCEFGIYLQALLWSVFNRFPTRKVSFPESIYHV